MDRKLKTFIIIAVLMTLIFPMTGCNRLNGKDRQTINEEDIPVVVQTPEKESLEPTQPLGEPVEEEISTEQPEAINDILVPFAENKGFSLLYGYADKSGKVVIKPKFT